MENQLKEIADKYECTYREEEGTYDLTFDIRNLPVKTVKFNKLTDDYELIVTCRFLWGTSSGPSLQSGNSSDQYRLQILCRNSKNKNIPDFHVMANDSFRKWLFGRDLKIQCRDGLFKRLLLNNNLVQTMYKLSRDSAEISPIISSRLENDQTEVEVLFNAFEFDAKIIKISMDFCAEMMTFNH